MSAQEDISKPTISNELVQQSKEWLAWRKARVGASDTPVIMGLSPYRTPYQLWAEKCGIETPEQAGYAAQRGIAMEPAAREAYTLLTGIEMTPKVVEFSTLPWFVASLDGINEDKQLLLEIKCNGKTNHSLALSGVIPEAHYWQMQHQLLAANLLVGHYYSFDGENGVMIVLEANLLDQAKILTAAKLFYESVQKREPPELSARDFVEIRDEKMHDLVGAWKDLEHSIKDLEKTQKAIREQILLGLKHPRVKLNGVSITTSFRRGNINYSSIPELKEVNLEAYRGRGSNVVSFREEK